MELKDSTKITITDLPKEPLMHKMVGTQQVFFKRGTVAVVLIIAAGVLSGYLLFSTASKEAGIIPAVSQSGTDKIVGSSDVKTFSDTAEGTLEIGGIDGEGTHRLIRPGGESQTVYLTSSVLDLNLFVGKKVRVWGETFAAQKAGWLMDVGKIEVL